MSSRLASPVARAPVPILAAAAVGARATSAPAPADRSARYGSAGLPPDEDSHEDQPEQDHDERPECRDPPQIPEQPEDLVPDEQMDEQTPDATAAEGQVVSARQAGARQAGGEAQSVVREHTFTMPPAEECFDRGP